MWYAANGCLQIMLFSLIAIKIKSKTPGAHTFPEIILTKHGKIAHWTYLIMGLATNMLVGATLVLAGSQIVAALTGMNVYAACFLIPIVVGAYVIVGGLRSTFIAAGPSFCRLHKLLILLGLCSHCDSFYRDIHVWLYGLSVQRSDWKSGQILHTPARSV